MIDYKYIICNTNELSGFDFSTVEEDSLETARKTIDETKTLLTYYDDIPHNVANLKSKEGPYSFDEIQTILTAPTAENIWWRNIH